MAVVITYKTYDSSFNRTYILINFGHRAGIYTVIMLSMLEYKTLFCILKNNYKIEYFVATMFAI